MAAIGNGDDDIFACDATEFGKQPLGAGNVFHHFDHENRIDRFVGERNVMSVEKRRVYSELLGFRDVFLVDVERHDFSTSISQQLCIATRTAAEIQKLLAAVFEDVVDQTTIDNLEVIYVEIPVLGITYSGRNFFY